LDEEFCSVGIARGDILGLEVARFECIVWWGLEVLVLLGDEGEGENWRVNMPLDVKLVPLVIQAVGDIGRGD